MFENQVGTSLADLAISLPEEKSDQVAGRGHLVEG